MLQFTTKLAAAAMSSFLILGAGAAMAGSGEAADTTNIHAGPSNGSRIVDQLYAGEPIDIRACRGNWCFITHPGPDGWVRAGALQQANYDYDDAPAPSYGGGGFVVINPPGGHPHKPWPGIIVDPVHTHPNGPIVGANPVYPINPVVNPNPGNQPPRNPCAINPMLCNGSGVHHFRK